MMRFFLIFLHKKRDIEFAGLFKAAIMQPVEEIRDFHFPDLIRALIMEHKTALQISSRSYPHWDSHPRTLQNPVRLIQ
jgi:hypothetical protein